MPKTKKTAKKSSSSRPRDDSSLKDMLLQVVGSFARNFFDQLQEGVASKVKEITQEVKRTVTVTGLVLLGMIFMFIGLASVVDLVVGIKGAGFLFIGFVLMFFGIFMNILTKKT